MNILVIAPHPDDESIGCGGTILLHAERGDRVATVFLTSGELGLKHLPKEDAWRIREAEAAQAAGMLGISTIEFLRLPDWFLADHFEHAAQMLAPLLVGESPDLISLPHSKEWHPDHAVSLQIVHRAMINADMQSPELITYEIWTPLTVFDHVEDISAVMGRKLEAVRAYQSQLAGFKYDRAVHGLNEYRGALAARCDYAEVFQYAEGAP